MEALLSGWEPPSPSVASCCKSPNPRPPTRRNFSTHRPRPPNDATSHQRQGGAAAPPDIEGRATTRPCRTRKVFQSSPVIAMSPAKLKLLRRLKNILPAGEIIFDPQILANYAGDKWFASHQPDALALPRSTQSVSILLRFANRHRIPGSPRGAGHGYVGGCVPVRGGIVLSLERMNRIQDINAADFVAVVEPGVNTKHLQDRVERRGLFYPPDPASRADNFIGGNIATNAGGPRCLKYGVTRDYVLGLDVMLAAAYKRTKSERLRGCRAHLIVELDGQKNSVRAEIKELEQIIRRQKPLFVERGLGVAQCEAVWKIRREFSYALRDTGLTKLNEDVVVPRSRLEDLFKFAARLQKKHGLPVACFGHAGDGNIHTNVMVDLTQPRAKQRAEAALDELFAQVISWGGAISGEHGIGLAKKRWWPLAVSKEVRELHRVVKHALDPKGILNPGKFV